MPNVYRNLSDNLAQVRGIAFDAGPAALAMRNTPAGRIMLQRRPRNFTQLFRAFVDGYANLWSWNPGPRTPSAGEVLDGVRMYGQCASFARALALLAKCPTPYGLGLGDDQVEVVRYQGFRTCGFISPHDGTYFGLDRNVKVPGSHPPQLADLYYWDNHYVVKYLGRYYDPSCDTEYTTLDEMAVYELVPGLINHNGSTFEKATGFRQTGYFKQAMQQIGTTRIAVEGPYHHLP